MARFTFTTGLAAIDALSKINYEELNYASAREAFDALKQSCYEHYKTVTDMPLEDIIAGGVSFATQCYLQGKCAQHIQKFYARTQHKIVRQLRHIDWKKIAAKRSPGFIDLFAKDKLPPAIERLSRYTYPEGTPLEPHIIEVIGNSRTCFQKTAHTEEESVIKALRNFLQKKGITYTKPILLKDIDFKHGIVGDVSANGKKLSGLHTTRWCPEKKVEIIKPCNEYGIWEGRWFCNNKSKKSSFFPTSLDEHDLINLTIDSLKNPVHIEVKIDGLDIVGTNKNIDTLIFLSDFGLVETFFPLWEGYEQYLKNRKIY